MVAAHTQAPSARREHGIPPPPADVDQRVVLHGISWRDYCVLRDLLDGPGVRLTYLQGALEITSPSRLHESIKSRIGRLLELFALERDLPLYAYGSTTFRSEPGERGLEPDECYTVGREMGEYPELAIEVALTTGGLNKLAVYRGLGVREVWIWEDGALHVHVLGERGDYEERDRSQVVPGIDLAVLARWAGEPDQHAAVKGYRESLRSVP